MNTLHSEHESVRSERAQALAEGAGQPRLSSLWSAALEDFFRRRNDALPPFLALYDASIRFEDPAHAIDGIVAFAEMNRRFAERARVLQITVSAVADSDEGFFATWTMDFAPRIGPRMTMDGVTRVRSANHKIVYQRDYFDPMGSFARAIPGISPLYRFLMRVAA